MPAGGVEARGSLLQQLFWGSELATQYPARGGDFLTTMLRQHLMPVVQEDNDHVMASFSHSDDGEWEEEDEDVEEEEEREERRIMMVTEDEVRDRERQLKRTRDREAAMEKWLTKVDGWELGFECCICLEEMCQKEESRTKRTLCGHIFHGDCIRRWLKLRETCPLCRFQVLPPPQA